MTGWESDPEYARLCREVARLSALIPKQNQLNRALAYMVRLRKAQAARDERWNFLNSG